jgi:hypothetical protein
MAGELHVFDARQKWETPNTKAYTIRKSHTKSRSGCKTCKIRRVKVTALFTTNVTAYSCDLPSVMRYDLDAAHASAET